MTIDFKKKRSLRSISFIERMKHIWLDDFLGFDLIICLYNKVSKDSSEYKIIKPQTLILKH